MLVAIAAAAASSLPGAAGRAVASIGKGPGHSRTIQEIVHDAGAINAMPRKGDEYGAWFDLADGHELTQEEADTRTVILASKCDAKTTGAGRTWTDQQTGSPLSVADADARIAARGLTGGKWFGVATTGADRVPPPQIVTIGVGTTVPKVVPPLRPAVVTGARVDGAPGPVQTVTSKPGAVDASAGITSATRSFDSIVQGVPTWAWIAGGALVVIGAAYALTRSRS